MVEYPEVEKIKDYRLAFYFVVTVMKVKVHNTGDKPGYPIPLCSSLYQDVEQSYHDSEATDFYSFSVKHHPTDVLSVL